MEKVYSTKIPLKALRGMAGQNQKRGLFWCVRAGHIPCEDLQMMIFPEIDSVNLSLTLDSGKNFF
jgi:hypothetical protein